MQEYEISIMYGATFCLNIPKKVRKRGRNGPRFVPRKENGGLRSNAASRSQHPTLANLAENWALFTRFYPLYYLSHIMQSFQDCVHFIVEFV